MLPVVNGGAVKVSVCVITYNHECYIGPCLESLVEQETNFSFEIIVAEDCSTDYTREIVLDYAARYPSLIRPLLAEKNIGGTQNFLALHNAARGHYVAHIDGDDLALPGKLARQATLLDVNPDLVVCGHRAGIISEDGRSLGKSFPRRLAEEFDVADAIKFGMPMLNSTLMYRRSARSLRAADYEIFDWYFLTDLLMKGRGGFIGDQLGLYRLNSQSMTASIRRIGMLNGLMGSYVRRLGDLPAYKAEFFAYALFELMDCIRRRQPVSATHWKLLCDTASPLGLMRWLDTFRWRCENLGVLER